MVDVLLDMQLTSLGLYGGSNKMKEIKLKPCPFCGGEDIQQYEHDMDCWASASIDCNGCNAGISGTSSFRYNDEKGRIKTIEKCIESWNKRPDIIESPTECAHLDDHFADAGKMADEKPPLKLRVGGVYRNRRGDVESVSKRAPHPLNCGFDFVGDETEIIYKENGSSVLHGENDYDLIEEVASDSVKSAVQDELMISASPDTTVDEKEAVEYCECHEPPYRGSHHGNLRCELCKKPIEGFRFIGPGHSLRDTEKYTAEEKKFCHHDKSIYYGCFKCLLKINQVFQDENNKLKGLIKKSTGNPFKVGDEVIYHVVVDVVGGGGVFQEKNGTGVISKIEGNVVYIKDAWQRFLHYKQCELVGGK